MSADREHEFTDEEAAWMLTPDDYEARLQAEQREAERSARRTRYSAKDALRLDLAERTDGLAGIIREGLKMAREVDQGP